MDVDANPNVSVQMINRVTMSLENVVALLGTRDSHARNVCIKINGSFSSPANCVLLRHSVYTLYTCIY